MNCDSVRMERKNRFDVIFIDNFFMQLHMCVRYSLINRIEIDEDPYYKLSGTKYDHIVKQS